MSGWIGVDLDGTLAVYDGWRDVGHIGPPVPAMLARVKAWLAEGREVRVVTARVGGWDSDAARSAIEEWCVEHVGEKLVVTCAKDFGMIELWDDRAVQVETNTGRIKPDLYEPAAGESGPVFRISVDAGALQAARLEMEGLAERSNYSAANRAVAKLREAMGIPPDERTAGRTDA
jgi:hypothetical protein